MKNLVVYKQIYKNIKKMFLTKKTNNIIKIIKINKFFDTFKYLLIGNNYKY